MCRAAAGIGEFPCEHPSLVHRRDRIPTPITSARSRSLGRTHRRRVDVLLPDPNRCSQPFARTRSVLDHVLSTSASRPVLHASAQRRPHPRRERSGSVDRTHATLAATSTSASMPTTGTASCGSKRWPLKRLTNTPLRRVAGGRPGYRTEQPPKGRPYTAHHEPYHLGDPTVPLRRSTAKPRPPRREIGSVSGRVATHHGFDAEVGACVEPLNVRSSSSAVVRHRWLRVTTSCTRQVLPTGGAPETATSAWP